MIHPVPLGTFLAPNLALGLYKIRRTVTPRLAIGYHLVPRDGYITLHPLALTPREVADIPVRHPGRFLQFLGFRGNVALRQIHGNLGAALEADRILTGGIVGEILPLSVQRFRINNDPLVGGQIDVFV